MPVLASPLLSSDMLIVVAWATAGSSRAASCATSVQQRALTGHALASEAIQEKKALCCSLALKVDSCLSLAWVQGIPTVQRAVINKTLIKAEKDWAVPGNINTKDEDKKEFT